MEKVNVVVVGAGFGGLSAAKVLAKSKLINLTVVDRRNYHLFQPLLYQVATAGLSPADIAVPIRSELSKFKNTHVFLGNVVGVNLKERVLETETEKISYDYLILACGAKHSYFGHQEWEENAPGLKTLEQATEIRRRVFLAFELAEREKDIEKQKSLLTFVIVGGGPTGVELAGSIAEISRHTLEKDFRNIDPSRTRVILIEAGQRLVAGFDPELSKRAARDLESLGVHIWTSTRVTNITEEGVYFGQEFIKAKTILWAAGVEPSSLGKSLGTSLDRVGRVIVNQDLAIKEDSHVFVIGDQASFVDEKGNALPGLAPVAMQQGRHAARNILKMIRGKNSEPFEYLDKGQLATIGRSKALMQFKSIKMGGFFAWLAWLFVHVYYLIGFKNKFFVIFQWTWSYVTFKRGARLISAKDWRSGKSPEKPQ